jgi:hypothetical protein
VGAEDKYAKKSFVNFSAMTFFKFLIKMQENKSQ